jgi:hypothetical protein
MDYRKGKGRPVAECDEMAERGSEMPVSRPEVLTLRAWRGIELQARKPAAGSESPGVYMFSGNFASPYALVIAARFA